MDGNRRETVLVTRLHCNLKIVELFFGKTLVRRIIGGSQVRHHPIDANILELLYGLQEFGDFIT